MARTLSVFRDGLAEVEKANAKVAEEREAATRERRQAMMALASEFEARVMGVVESVNEASGAVQQSAAGMSDSAKGASTKAEAAGAAAQRAASNVQTVADRKSTRLNSSHECATRMPSSA